MDWRTMLPFWPQLDETQRRLLEASAVSRQIAAGRTVHGGSGDCAGLLLVQDGRLRAFLVTDEGRELTLYRLLPGELCLFSASCMLRGMEVDVLVEAEADTRLTQLPAPAVQQVLEQSAPAANWVNQLMAARFSDVLWRMEQILSKKLDGRLAAFLLEEARLQGTDRLRLTHDQIARHLGSAREVVTRLLRYFQEEGLVRLSRGGVALADRAALADLAADSLRP